MAKLINLIPNNNKPKQNEALEDMDVALPAKVEKFLDRAINIIKGYRLPRKKEQLVIAKIVDAMNLSTSELNQAVTKLKKYGIVTRKKTGNADHDFMGEDEEGGDSGGTPQFEPGGIAKQISSKIRNMEEAKKSKK